MSDEVVQQAETEVIQPDVQLPAEGQEPDSKAEHDGEDEGKKKESGFQRRINRLTREKYELAARLKILEEQRQPTAEKPQSKGEPKLEDYGENTAQYVKDLAAYIADQKLEEREAKRSQEREQERGHESEAKLMQDWQRKVQRFAKEHPEAAEAIEDADIPVTPAMSRAIMESDMGPQVAHYLATHPDEAETLADLSPTAVARAIGRIEAKLEQNPPKKSSNAPRPVNPVGGRGAPVSKSLHELDTADFIRTRNEQERKR